MPYLLVAIFLGIEFALFVNRKKHGHRRRLFVFFFRSGDNWLDERRIMSVKGILVTDVNTGVFVALAELDPNGGPIPLSAGPFQIDVADPDGVAKVIPGSADNTTPTRIVASGSGVAGSVNVTVTDLSDPANPLVGKATLSVDAVPPPPPPPPSNTLVVTFETATPPAPQAKTAK